MTISPHVAVLVSAPDRSILTPALLQAAKAALGTDARETWLAKSEAAEIVFPADDAHVAARTGELRDLIGEAPIDLAILPAEGRRKKLMIADMDSTMIREEGIDELAGEFGLRDKIAVITNKTMRGEIAFEPALRQRVALFAGMPASAIQAVLGRIQIMPGAEILVRTMRAHGAYTALVSGGFTAFTGPVAERIGFDENRGNGLVIEGDKFTGQVTDPVLDRDAKRATLIELRDRFGLAESETLAVGDGANDMAMVTIAGLGVAFQGKPALVAVAPVRIDHGDLTALLYLQGYSKDEFWTPA